MLEREDRDNTARRVSSYVHCPSHGSETMFWVEVLRAVAMVKETIWWTLLRERVMEISGEPRLQACETLEMGGDSLGGAVGVPGHLLEAEHLTQHHIQDRET